MISVVGACSYTENQLAASSSPSLASYWNFMTDTHTHTHTHTHAHCGTSAPHHTHILLSHETPSARSRSYSTPGASYKHMHSRKDKTVHKNCWKHRTLSLSSFDEVVHRRTYVYNADNSTRNASIYFMRRDTFVLLDLFTRNNTTYPPPLHVT